MHKAMEGKEEKMGSKISSSEIDQMVLEWKKGVLKYTPIVRPEEMCKIEGHPKVVLDFFKKMRDDPGIKIISLAKAFELKDVPEKIWTPIKRLKYIPMFFRSWKNELRYILRETCSFNRMENK